MRAVRDDPAEGTTLVLASNLGGGIARHLALVGSVVSIDVHELPDRDPLPIKMRAARHLLRKTGARLVVTHGVAAAISVRHRGRRLAGVRHIEHWHGDPFFLAPRRRDAYRLLARAGRAPELQVFTHGWLAPLYSDRRSPVQVLSNTVPVTQRAPREPGGADGQRRAVYLGRLSQEKGLVDLLTAWPEDSHARGWELDIYGSGPLADLPVPTGVTLHGEISDSLQVLLQADLVVVPSWIETGPYSAHEAMSAGAPFIGTRTGDMPELLASGCGWSVPRRSPEELRAALLVAQATPAAELAAMGERGRRWLADNRPFSAWATEVARIYS
jgi:glycosyltransferase involved in cell wall biosynthesis